MLTLIGLGISSASVYAWKLTFWLCKAMQTPTVQAMKKFRLELVEQKSKGDVTVTFFTDSPIRWTSVKWLWTACKLGF